MGNPFKHTEPDFSNDSEMQCQPDGEPYLAQMSRALVSGNFTEQLLITQKMLFHFGRDPNYDGEYLCMVGNAWERLGYIDHAIAYHQEAIEHIQSHCSFTSRREGDWENVRVSVISKLNETIKSCQARIEELQWMQSVQNNPPLRLYIDMDDVLCDYMKAHEKELSYNPKNTYPQSREGFYLDLEPIKGAIKAMDWIANNKNIDGFILTAPSIYNPHSYTEKRLWIEKHMGFDWCNRLVLSPVKSIMQKGLLIDDRIEGHGKENFNGKILHFGYGAFGNWQKIVKYLDNFLK